MTNEPSKNRTGSARLEELSRQKKERHARSRLPLILIVGAAVIIVGLIVAVVVNTVTSDSTDNEQDITQITRSVSGKSVDEDKKDAANAAATLLTASKSEGDYRERMATIESGDISSVPEGMTNGIHLSEGMDSEGARGSTYQALVALNGLMLEGRDAKLVSDDAWESVQVDSETGIAYVPLSILVGKDVPFSFEMVYVDGEWKLAPYSLLQAIQMSSLLTANAEGATAAE